MRLLITADTVGGVWTYARELTEGLLSRGHDVLLTSMGRLPSVDQKAWARGASTRWSETFHYVATECPLEWMTQNQRCYLDAEEVLLQQIDTFGPDVLHLNQFCYGALPTRIPKVVMAHSDVMSWSTCCRGVLPDHSSWFTQYLRVVSDGLAQADAVVAPTYWMLESLRENYSLPEHQAVIPNGRALPSLSRPGKRKMQAVTIGRVWDEGKNVRLLEDIDAPMPLLVGGELALDDGAAFCSSRLQLLEHLSEEASLRLFAESAIYIVTSRYEPFGLAPLEAALSGCAILAHDIASLREVWGDSALYFDSASALSQQLELLHTDSALLRHMAKAAYSHARARYSQGAMVERYLHLYASLGAAVEAPETQHAS